MQPALATLEEKLLPVHTALLVIDMQNDFCAEGGCVHKPRGASQAELVAVPRLSAADCELLSGFAATRCPVSALPL